MLGNLVLTDPWTLRRHCSERGQAGPRPAPRARRPRVTVPRTSVSRPSTARPERGWLPAPAPWSSPRAVLGVLGPQRGLTLLCHDVPPVPGSTDRQQ